MIRSFSVAAGVLGALVIAWMAYGFVGTDVLALMVTVVIGMVYCVGCIEQYQFKRATASLARALDEAAGPVNSLDRWLDLLHPSLQNAVQTRIEGERVGLPAPMLTPYLVGLLVMLGLIGTFVGMVVTLQGAVVALEGSTELQAIRAGLAAPIGGLGLAFGTSVAGVAASAMLGLISTLSRRERMMEAARLDRNIHTVFRDFSLVHNRKETYKALQYQSDALPKVVDKLAAMAEQLEQMGVTIERTLTQKQDQLHSNIAETYQMLAESVDASLKQTLLESSRSVGEGIQPIVLAAMASVNKESQQAYQKVSELAQEQMKALSEGFTQTAQDVTHAWQKGVASHQQINERWAESVSESFDHFKSECSAVSNQLIQTFSAQTSEWLKQQLNHDDLRSQALRETLTESEQKLAATLEQTSTQFSDEMHNMVEQQRELVSARVASEHAWMEGHQSRIVERNEFMNALRALLTSVDQTTKSQRESIEALTRSSSEALFDTSRHFSEHVDAGLSKIKGIADQVSGGAIELSTLGETFGVAVDQFSRSNQALISSLDRIESSLESSTVRSDEQLAYYVNQAREIIDHSMMSQKTLLEELRRIGDEARQQDAELCR